MCKQSVQNTIKSLIKKGIVFKLWHYYSNGGATNKYIVRDTSHLVYGKITMKN